MGSRTTSTAADSVGSPAPTSTRIALLVLAAGQLVPGTWATLAPEGFFARFPGTGVAWAPAGGPFNLHLVIDAGAGFLATGVALLLAAVWLRRPGVVVALAAYIAHAVPHAAFHLSGATPALPAPDQAASVISLVAGAVAAAVLLVVWVAGRPARAMARPPVRSARRRPRSCPTTCELPVCDASVRRG